MSARRTTIAASVIASVIAIAVAACSAFSGQDTSPSSDTKNAGGATLEGGALVDGGADMGCADTGNRASDAGVPSASCNPSPCAAGGAYIFCDDFESVTAPRYGFDASAAPSGTSIGVVLSGDGKTHLLRVINDPAGLEAGVGAPDVYLAANFDQGAGDAKLEYDFFLQASALSHQTLGVLVYANMNGNDEVGVGANLNILGQPRQPSMGVGTVTASSLGVWHHVKATGASAKGLTSTTTIDGIPVQALVDSGIIPDSPRLFVGITECGFKMSPGAPATVSYYDNIVVR